MNISKRAFDSRIRMRIRREVEIERKIHRWVVQTQLPAADLRAALHHVATTTFLAPWDVELEHVLAAMQKTREP